MGAVSGGPWSMSVREEEVDHVLDVLVVDQVADLPIDVGGRRPVREVDLHPRTVNRRQPGMGAQVGDLVVKGLGGRRVLGGGALERVDVRPQGGDLGAQRGVGLLQVLDAAHERLVTGDLVGGRQELSLDLARHQEPGRERDRRDDKDAQDAVARHDAILVYKMKTWLSGRVYPGRHPAFTFQTPPSVAWSRNREEIGDFLATYGVPSETAHGGRDARFRFPDRPAPVRFGG